jgi:hypothetical protein
LVERRSQNFAEAWAFNPEYAFRLSSGGQPASKWNVSFAGASSGKDANYVQADIEWSDVSRFLRAPWQLGISPMRLLAESPHFHVESAAEAPPRNGVRVVELRFTFSPPEKPPAHAMSEMTWMETPMRSGTVSLAPEWSWAILGFDIVSKGGGRTRREVTYDGLVDGFPRLRRVVDRLGGPDVTGERVIRCEVGDWVRREIPPAEFTLAAYGMPEFVAGRNPFLARVTFLIVAIVVVSLALAAGLNFVNKRRRAA